METSMDGALLLTFGLQLNPETESPRLLNYSHEQTLSSDFSLRPLLSALPAVAQSTIYNESFIPNHG